MCLCVYYCIDCILSTVSSLLLFGNLSTPDGLVLFDARQSRIPSWQSWTSSHDSFTWNKIVKCWQDKTRDTSTYTLNIIVYLFWHQWIIKQWVLSNIDLGPKFVLWQFLKHDIYLQHGALSLAFKGIHNKKNNRYQELCLTIRRFHSIRKTIKITK